MIIKKNSHKKAINDKNDTKSPIVAICEDILYKKCNYNEILL